MGDSDNISFEIEQQVSPREFNLSRKDILQCTDLKQLDKWIEEFIYKNYKITSLPFSSDFGLSIELFKYMSQKEEWNFEAEVLYMYDLYDERGKAVKDITYDELLKEIFRRYQPHYIARAALLSKVEPCIEKELSQKLEAEYKKTRYRRFNIDKINFALDSGINYESEDDPEEEDLEEEHEIEQHLRRHGIKNE